MSLSSSFIRQALQLPIMRLDGSERRPSVWAAILGGAGLGLLWGIAARIWMRLISTQPEFSVFGTMAILIISTVFGAWVGLAFAARRRGWRRWGHYLPRSLMVAFFIPFGAFGGLPLMLTVLVATLGVTQRAVVSLWFLAALAMLLAQGTDLGLPVQAVGIALAGAIAVTVWKGLVPRWRDRHKLLLVNTWLEQIVRGILLLLALSGFWFVATDILSSKPILLGLVYVCFYFILLYPLFLALRVGLEPRASTEARATTQS
ncbi:MAG: hypothetical protein ACT4QE_25380, partial [Anaerolineales bacterium]